MKVRILFLALLFVLPKICADDIKDSKINPAVTTAALVFLATKAGVIKGLAPGCRGLVASAGPWALVLGAAYGIKKGWDWFVKNKEIEKLKKEMEELRKDVKEVGGDVKEVGEDVKGVGGDVKEVGEDVKGVGGDVEKVGEELKGVGEEVKRVGGYVNTLEKKTDFVRSEAVKGREQVQKRFDTTNRNIYSLEKVQGVIKGKIGTLATKTQVDKLSESQRTIQTGQEKLIKTILEKLGVVSEESEKNCKKLSEKITDFQEKFNGNNEELRILLQSMNLCKDEVSGLKKVILSSKIGTVRLSEKMAGLQQSNYLIHEKIDRLLEVVKIISGLRYGKLEKLREGQSRFGLCGEGIFDCNQAEIVGA